MTQYWDEHEERFRFGVDPELCPACHEGGHFCAFHRDLRAKGIQPQTRNLTNEQIDLLLKSWDEKKKKGEPWP